LGWHPVTVVQHTFTHEQYTQYSSTAHFYTQTVHTIQQYSTLLHTNSTHNTGNGAHITIRRKYLGSAGRAPSLRVIPWHLPNKPRKKHVKNLS
jgi:hypothetical protein